MDVRVQHKLIYSKKQTPQQAETYAPINDASTNIEVHQLNPQPVNMYYEPFPFICVFFFCIPGRKKERPGDNLSPGVMRCQGECTDDNQVLFDAATEVGHSFCIDG